MILGIKLISSMGYKPNIESRSEGNSVFLNELKSWFYKIAWMRLYIILNDQVM